MWAPGRKKLELSCVQGVGLGVAMLAFRRIVEIAQIGHQNGDLVGRYAIRTRLVSGDQPASILLPTLEDEDRVDGSLIGLLDGGGIEVAAFPDIDFREVGVDAHGIDVVGELQRFGGKRGKDARSQLGSARVDVAVVRRRVDETWRDDAPDAALVFLRELGIPLRDDGADLLVQPTSPAPARQERASQEEARR